MAKSVKKKRKVKVEKWDKTIYKLTFNNIIISLTNNSGQVIWSSLGRWDLKGLKRTLLMFQMAAEDLCPKLAFEQDLEESKYMLKDLGGKRICHQNYS